MKLVPRVQDLGKAVESHLSNAGVFDAPSDMAEEYEYEAEEAFARNTTSWDRLADGKVALHANNCIIFNHDYGEVKVVWLGKDGVVASHTFYLPKQTDKIKEVMFMS